MRILHALALVAACRPPGYDKQPPPDAAARSDVPASIDAASDAASALCDHEFRLDDHATSSSVWLTGDFVSWAGNPQAGAVELALGAAGTWMGSYTLERGVHQYKFIVDSTQWIADPANPDQIDDGFGGKNSVTTCMP